MSYRVRLSPPALKQLDDIKDYITAAGSPGTAMRYVEGIADFCGSLSTFPMRGQPRDDLMKGLRVSGYRRQAVIVFLVDEAAQTVAVIGIYYGGQDYESRFAGDLDD